MFSFSSVNIYLSNALFIVCVLLTLYGSLVSFRPMQYYVCLGIIVIVYNWLYTRSTVNQNELFKAISLRSKEFECLVYNIFFPPFW